MEDTANTTVKMSTDTALVGELANHMLHIYQVRRHEEVLSKSPDLPKGKHLVSKDGGTETCHHGCSRLHQFTCSHILHTIKPSVCGSKCAAPIANFAPFACTLCERLKRPLKRSGARRSTHIADLILPDSPAPDQSNVPHMFRSRPCDIVYPHQDGTICIVLDTEDIAMVRISEALTIAK